MKVGLRADSAHPYKIGLAARYYSAAMPMPQDLFALILASIAVMGSPGPSTISLTAMAAAFGLRGALRYGWGLVAGTIAVLLSVAFGLVALLLAVPGAAPVLLGVSALYILWLAYQIATAPPLGAKPQDMQAPAFMGGLLLAIANPKAYLAIAAVFAGNTLLPGQPGPDAALKIAVLSGMIALIHLAWLLAGAAFARALHDPFWSRVVNITLAIALVVMTGLALLG